jgi:hypothetical protein
MMLDLAGRWRSELKNAACCAMKAPRCVPGGTTPGPVFDALSEQPLWTGRGCGGADRRALGARGQPALEHALIRGGC